MDNERFREELKKHEVFNEADMRKKIERINLEDSLFLSLHIRDNLGGSIASMVLLMEEMAELQKEICKRFRDNKSNGFPILEELADVYIMLYQLRLEIGIEDDMIKNAISVKIREYFNKDKNET